MIRRFLLGKVLGMRGLPSACATCAALSIALFIVTGPAFAQDRYKQLPDSTKRRLFACGTHAAVLQRRQATTEVKQALDKVHYCPEGPETIASLWTTAPSDVGYLVFLVGATDVSEHRVALALIGAVSDRSRSTVVRLRALGSILQGLTGEYTSSITIVPGPRRANPAGGEPLPSEREARLQRWITHKPEPVAIEPGVRTEILAAINRVAADSSDVEDMRLAAREVARVLSPPARGR